MAADLIGACDRTKKDILDRIAQAIPECSLTASPPEMGQRIYAIVRSVTGCDDPYLPLKKKSHAQVMAHYADFKRRIDRSRNRLLTALELAIAGNIIDFGAGSCVDVPAEIETILRQEERAIRHADERCFQYALFFKKLAAAHNVLYLADNVGETVFDGMLLEQIRALYPATQLWYAVRGFPVINDALEEDAYNAGIDTYARIINNGYDAPGTILKKSSAAFQKIFKAADLIISKGQGNFESLSGRTGDHIFFLFMAKCAVVARHLTCAVGTVILQCNQPQRRGSA